MPARSRPRISKCTSRTTWLAIMLLGLALLAGAGIPPLTVAAAADLVPSASPSASPAPAVSPAPSAFPTPAVSPSPSSFPAPSASPTPSAGPRTVSDPSASASPDPSVVPSPTPTASPTPPPGAIATVATDGQPYDLPAFVGLGGMQAASASFYGPGFYCVSDTVAGCDPQGGRAEWHRLTACGVLYTQTVVGVASRTLPCGTLVAFSYAGRTIVAPVIDRGPYVAGRLWDLSGGLCTMLRHCFTGPIRWAIARPAIGSAGTVRVDLRRS